MNEAEWGHIEWDEASLMIEFTETIIQNREASVKSEFNHVMMSATFFTNLIQKKEEKQKKIEVFLISIINIEKALTSQKKTDLRTILSDHYHEFLDVFNHTMTEKLPPLREEGTDHQIKLKEVNEKESKVPWDSLYNMTREKLLVLRKTLTELLNKQFIQVSNSSAAASVLFVWKSEGELWFCVNYCDLNQITQKNHYPLSLIYETFAEHWMSSVIHQVECHSSISQDLNCCRRQMKDSVLYEVQVVWMNDDFFWASQCLKHLSKIY